MIGEWTAQRLHDCGYPTHYSKQITSTNLRAKDSAIAEEAPVVFYLTDAQSLGRGQGDHKWINAAPGTNLLITCSMQSTRPPQPELCLNFGEHLKGACMALWPELNWRIKPPNDLFLQDQKVAGILLESVSQGSKNRLLFGLGFNVLEAPISSEFECTYLQKYLNSTLSQSQWNLFLDELLSRILGDQTIG